MKIIVASFILSTFLCPRGIGMKPSTQPLPSARGTGTSMPSTSVSPLVKMPGATPKNLGIPMATQAPLPTVSAPMPGAHMATRSVPMSTNTQSSLVKIDENNPEVQKYKQDLDAITSSLQQLDQVKTSLKNDLQDLDKKLDAAHQQAAEAKKMSFDILQQESEQQSRTMVEKVRDNLKKVQELQQFVQITFSNSFNKKITDIKVLMANLTTMIQQLETKVGIMPTAKPKPAPSPQPIMSTPIAGMKASTISQQLTPAPQHPITVPPQPEVPSTFFGNIRNKSAEVTAWLIKQSKLLTDWILTPAPHDVKKKKKINEELIPQASTYTIITPVTLPDVSRIKLEDQMKTYVITFHNTMKKIDEKRIEFSEQYHDIKMTHKPIKEKIATFKFLHDYLEIQKKEENIEEIPVWRKLAEHGFSRALDLIIFIARYTKIGIIKVYNYFFAQTIHEFTEDVKEKLKEMETQKPQLDPNNSQH